MQISQAQSKTETIQTPFRCNFNKNFHFYKNKLTDKSMVKLIIIIITQTIKSRIILIIAHKDDKKFPTIIGQASNYY